MHRRAHIILVLILLLTSGLSAKDKKALFHDIRAESGQVTAHLEVVELLDDDLIQGLQKGMTAALEYQVQLWEERTGWADRLLEERYHRMKLAFDPWSKRFTVETREGPPLLLSEEALRQRCADLESLRVAPLDMLEKDKSYYIGVRIILKPVSMESMEEISKWLGGEVKAIDPKAVIQAQPSTKKTSRWLMGLVLNITGFGDRVITAKSPRFTLREDWQKSEGRPQ